MKSKKIIFIFIVAIAFLLLCSVKANASLELNELTFNAQINTDGSMDVTETWNIDISETNTLFKTFKKDNSKYSEITDVTVRDVTASREFTQIYEEMYHVTENCYYGLNNSKGMFEIAWGVGLENDSYTRTYEISYKVEDAIATYNDYAELYWQFIGEDFEIDADKIKGTILLPMNAQSKEDIRVWGHTKDLNGEIYVTDTNKIEFTINRYSSGNYVEVRTLLPKDMIASTNRIYDRDILGTVLDEENKWADEANARREARKMIIYIIIGILSLITVFFIIKMFKNLKKLRKMDKKIKPSTELEYFRELPYEDATPAEALFMITSGYNTFFSSSFAANILDLCLKKYLTLELEEKNGKFQSDVVKITLLENKDLGILKDDQKLTWNFLKQVAKDKNTVTTKEITQYLEKHTSKIQTLDKDLKKTIEKEETNTGNYKKGKHQENLNYQGICVVYAIFAIITILFIPLAIVLGINAILLGKMASRTNPFTQAGVDEKEKWKAFKNYMKDFSLLKEKEIPALVVWEKYLVFATVFGISDKVLKQLKVVYPEITNMDSAMYTYSYIHIMNSINIGDCINSSVYSATYSSGSGAGGGFSGGGGGGRWPEVAVADAKAKTQKTKYKKVRNMFIFFTFLHI